MIADEDSLRAFALLKALSPACRCGRACSERSATTSYIPSARRGARDSRPPRPTRRPSHGRPRPTSHHEVEESLRYLTPPRQGPWTGVGGRLAHRQRLLLARRLARHRAGAPILAVVRRGGAGGRRCRERRLGVGGLGVAAAALGRAVGRLGGDRGGGLGGGAARLAATLAGLSRSARESGTHERRESGELAAAAADAEVIGMGSRRTLRRSRARRRTS